MNSNPQVNMAAPNAIQPQPCKTQKRWVLLNCRRRTEKGKEYFTSPWRDRGTCSLGRVSCKPLPTLQGIVLAETPSEKNPNESSYSAGRKRNSCPASLPI